MKRKERKRQAAIAEHREAMSGEIKRMIASLDDFRAFKKHARKAKLPIRLKPREVPLCVGESAFKLIEPRQSPGKIKGFSGSVGIPVGPTLINVGGVKGKYEPGRIEFEVVDPARSRQTGGHIVVTDRRLVYVGKHRTAEWRFDRLVRIEHVDNSSDPFDALLDKMLPIPSATLIHMEDRDYVSGVAYVPRDADLFRLRLDFGLAIHDRRRKEFAQSLEEKLAATTDGEEDHTSQL